VERRPVDRPATEADVAHGEVSFEVRDTAEEAVVAKDARVVEEVVVGKEASDRTETISDSVRRTDVDVETVEDEETTATRNSEKRSAR
jgi:stress response protein YsnF